MPKKTEAQYLHEKQILDGALARGGADVTFPSHGKAINFRQRCYTFRKFMRERLGDSSPYEALVIQQIAKDSGVVRIRGRELEAEVTFLDGPPIATAAAEPEDDLAFTVAEIAQKIKGDLEL